MTLSTQTLRSDPRVAEILKARFGHDGFLPLQEDVIENVLAGGDSIVLMPTGSGKSLCYQLPALLLDGVTLVVSPLIALMKNQVDSLTTKGVSAAFINGTMSYAEILDVQKEARSGRLDILYVSPERLGARQVPRVPAIAEDRPDRHRRGALHLGVGPRFQARLPEPPRVTRRLPECAGDGPDSHRHRKGEGRRSRTDGHGRRAPVRHELQSGESDLPGPAQTTEF